MPRDGHSDASVNEVLDLIEKYLRATNGPTAQEQHDRYVGRLFGLQAVLDCDLLFVDHGLSDALPRFITEVYNLGQEKTWLREQCAWLTCLLQSMLEEKGAYEYRKRCLKIVKLTINLWCQGPMAMTPEGVAIWHQFGWKSGLGLEELPDNRWNRHDVYHPDNLETLALVMGETTGKKGEVASEDLIAVQKGHWNERVHFAWDILFEDLLYDGPILDRSSLKMGDQTEEEDDSQLEGTSDSDSDTEADSDTEDDSERPRAASLESFWKKVVDENLFSHSATEERNFWGLQLLLPMIKSKPAELVHPLITTGLVRTLMFHLMEKNRPLYALSQLVVGSMLERAAKDADAAISFVCGLTSADGLLFFDRTTRTRTVDSLLGRVFGKRSATLTFLFQDLIDTPKTQDPELAAKRRQIMASDLAECIKTGTARSEKHAEVKAIALMALIKYGWTAESMGTYKKHLVVPISAETRQVFRDKLMAATMDLMSQDTTDLGGLVTWPYQIVAGFTDLLKDQTRKPGLQTIPTFSESGKHKYELLIEMDPEIRKIRDDATKKVTVINEQRRVGQNSSQLEAFERLFSLGIIFLYNGDHDAVGMLEDITSCYDTSVMLKGRTDEATAEDSGDLIVELLLGFLSKPSASLRKLAQQVFVAFAPGLSISGLQILLDVIQSRETIQGQQDLFEKESLDDGSGEEHVEALDGSMMDGINVDEQGSGLAADETTDESSGSGDDDSDMEMIDVENDAGHEMDEANAKLDAALAAALASAAGPNSKSDSSKKPNGTAKPNGLTNGHHSASSSSSSDSDSDLTDTDMFAQDIDGKLSNIFRQRQEESNSASNKKKEGKQARENIIVFKNKVLDLLETYLKTKYANPVAFHDGILILGLLQAVRKTGETQLRDRIGKIVGTWCGKCRGKDMPVLDLGLDGVAGGYVATLKKIHTEAALPSTPPPHKKLCSQLSILITKILTKQVGGEKHLRDVLAVYMDTWEGWLLGKGGKKRTRKSGKKGKVFEGSGVQVGLFSDFVSWSVSARETLGKGAGSES